MIDAQYWSSTEYVGTTMNGAATVFGVNFVLESSGETVLRAPSGEEIVVPSPVAGGEYVDLQIGRSDDTKTYLRLYIPPDDSAAAAMAAREKFPAFAEYFVASGVIQSQCPGGGTCTKTCRDRNGKLYCCQWDCD